MTRFILSVGNRISSILYPLIVLAIASGFAYQAFRWMHNQSVNSDARFPSLVISACTIVALLIGAILMERLIPLQALSQERWIYKERPRNRMRSTDLITVSQVILFAFIGLSAGLLTGNIFLCLAASILVRASPLLRPRKKLPVLLAAGKRRILGSSFGFVLDSELIANTLATNWRHWTTTSSARGIVEIFFRRVFRRSYLLFTAALILLSAVAFSGSLRRVGIALFLLTWSILGAGFYRCADFSKLGIKSPYSVLVLVGHASIATIVVGFLWGLGNPLLIVPLIFFAVISIGILRRKPRQVMQMTPMDSGFGISAPPEVIHYFLSGLYLGLIPIALVALGA